MNAQRWMLVAVAVSVVGVVACAGETERIAATAAMCGDTMCDSGESALSCPEDCGTCGNGTCDDGEDYTHCFEDGCTCGNGMCDGDETFVACPDDCNCGNGVCDALEYFTSCPDDCYCGNRTCDDGEHVTSCPEDCLCGNGTCGSDESPASCPDDCYCGNGQCDSGEDFTNCLADGCGCGNGLCDLGDGVASCPDDCYCGNGTCDFGESPASCPEECTCDSNSLCETDENQFGCPADCAATTVAVASCHVCVSIADGTARCWGDNGLGALGDGTTTSSHVPVRVSGLTNVVRTSVSDGNLVGYPHPSSLVGATSCAQLVDSTVVCWGGHHTTDGYGQAGPSIVASAVPVALPELGDVADLVGTWAITSDRSLWHWWWDDYALETPHPDGPSDVVAFAQGIMDERCAAVLDGEVFCWGDSLAPVHVDGLTNIVALAMPADLWALRDDGTAWSCEWRTGICAAADLTGVVAISGRRAFYPDELGCALKADGTVWCWGGEEGSPSPPAPVPELTNVVAISTANLTSCALRADGTVWCWGDNECGQLGIGASSHSLPTRTPAVTAAW